MGLAQPLLVASADDAPSTDSVSGGTLDYLVCTSCDTWSADDSELRNLAEMIAAARWQMFSMDSGAIELSDQAGNTARWPWESDEGALRLLQPVTAAEAPDEEP